MSTFLWGLLFGLPKSQPSGLWLCQAPESLLAWVCLGSSEGTLSLDFLLGQGRPPPQCLHRYPESLHVCLPAPQCTHFNACALYPSHNPPSHTSGLFLTGMCSSFLGSSVQQVPNNVTENAAVLPWLTAFSCGYTLLSANRRT